MGRSRNNPVYATAAWRAVRKATLVRDGFRCRIGLPGCRRVASQADHVVELEEGGAPYDLANLQAACGSCNVAKRNIRVGREKHGQGRGVVRSW